MQKKQRTRRPYSRNGCQQCKARKLKCDETHPACKECLRLGKDCVYLKANIRFSDSRSFTTWGPMSSVIGSASVSKSIPKMGGQKQSSKAPQQLQIQLEVQKESETTVTEAELPVDVQEVKRESSPKLFDSSFAMSPTFSASLSPLLRDLESQAQHPDIPPLFTVNQPQLGSSSTDLLGPELTDGFFYFPLTSKIPIFDFSDRESQYLEIFYHRTSHHIMPFGMSSSNPIRDAIMTIAFQDKCLLRAVFAASSMTSFRITQNIDDYVQSTKYLAETLDSLSDRLIQSEQKSFEALVMTVLILCTDHTSSLNLSWRAHLRGAKDLIDRSKDLSCANSRDMAFCKVWFAALEVIASITSIRGGTVEEGITAKFNDMGLIQLQDAGLILPNGFNLFLGYSTSCLSIFSELAKLIKVSRETGLNVAENRSIEKLISDIHQAKQISFSDSRYNNFVGLFDPGTASEVADAENILELSDADWFCISHKAHCEAAMLAVYSSLLKLPVESPIVSVCEATLMGLLAQVPYKDTRGTMIHWPLLTAGICATSDAQEKFVLDRLELLRKNGVWSAEFSKIRVRERQRERQRFTMMLNDLEAEDEPDTVPF